MNIADFISKEEVQRVCQELGIRDWTKLTDTKVQESTGRRGQNYPGHRWI
jgi:hypothetical protein